MKTSEQKAIDEIMEEFDFKAVHTHMALVGWTYFDSPKTPTIARLEQTARSSLERSLTKDTTYIKSGGFRASASRSKEDPSELTLEFILTETSAYL